jgi:hypothetical protein
MNLHQISAVIRPLKHEAHLDNMYKFSNYLTENTALPITKTSRLMLRREITAACFTYKYAVLHISMLFYIYVCCFTYRYAVLHISMLFYIYVCCFTYKYAVLHISVLFYIYKYAVLHISMLFYI